jgi:CRISP-associated protein Cas1
MIKQTLYFGSQAKLSILHAQLYIEQTKTSDKTTIIKTLPLTDIGFVVLDHPQISLTYSVIAKLMEHNAIILTCDERHMPTAMTIPLEANTLQSERYRAQIEAPLPLKKQLWQQTIVSKLKNQAAVLGKTHKSYGRIARLVEQVRSGDPENLEAQGAAIYWPTLFSGREGFIRDRDGSSPNQLLNYGYAILRSIVARNLVVSGLLPTLGVHHRNKYNAFCLADDIMEPYRPFVDDLVSGMVFERDIEDSHISKDQKVQLLGIPVLDVHIDGCKRPLMLAVSQTTTSLMKCYMGDRKTILYPEFL